ncbi:ARM repeat-containing protein [Roridomyces roridus]|uniref:ARM repeat-containing protein n=1 Tax=Roridomyces roridus TaxID=1738132 RepID=A0AAD7C1V5_9AGAR|nr:ARM repeat-containing protein [Roridomyces roridus]
MTFTLARLKRVKNSVIGNPAAKVQLAQDEHFVASLVQCLNAEERELRIEAAHVIASISYGDEQVLATLLRCDAPRAFLYAISKLSAEDLAPLRAAFARGLRALAIALADAVGPSQWGLHDEPSALKGDADAALDYLFEISSIDLYLPLLTDVACQMFIAQLLAFSIRTAEHRAAVVDWLPAEDRMKEVKTKRGWEKTAANANAPTRQGGWLCRNLAGLAQSKDAKLQEAALWALATVAKDNSPVAAALAKDHDGPMLLPFILNLARSRAADIQLAACLCLTSIIRAPSSLAHGSHGHAPPVLSAADDAAARTVMNVLNRIISSPTESLSSRTKASFILFYLVTDHPALALAAFDLGSLRVLASALNSLPALPPGSPSPSPSPSVDSEIEPEPTPPSLLRESLLTTLAALSLFDNTIRLALADTPHPSLLPLIHSSLSHPRAGVRYAAAQCVRALSRAVAVLRTNIVDSGLGLAVFHLFLKPDEDRRVTGAALAAVCNIVNEFSPLRPIYLDLGLMPRLVGLLFPASPSAGEGGPGGDATLKLSSLWAVKNLLSKSSTETKRDVMAHLGWARLVGLLQDTDTSIQEQALHLVRNLAENEQGVDMFFRELDAEMLLSTLTRALSAEDDDVVLQATYVLANLANFVPSPTNTRPSSSSSVHPLLSSAQHTPRLLSALRTALAERTPPVRRPAVSAVLELARGSTAGRRALGEVGMVGTLKALVSGGTATSSGAGGPGSPTLTSSSPSIARGDMRGGGDERDVSDLARTALDWLEHGEVYR